MVLIALLTRQYMYTEKKTYLEPTIGLNSGRVFTSSGLSWTLLYYEKELDFECFLFCRCEYESKYIVDVLSEWSSAVEQDDSSYSVSRDWLFSRLCSRVWCILW